MKKEYQPHPGGLINASDQVFKSLGFKPQNFDHREHLEKVERGVWRELSESDGEAGIEKSLVGLNAKLAAHREFHWRISCRWHELNRPVLYPFVVSHPPSGSDF